MFRLSFSSCLCVQDNHFDDKCSYGNDSNEYTTTAAIIIIINSGNLYINNDMNIVTLIGVNNIIMVTLTTVDVMMIITNKMKLKKSQKKKKRETEKAKTHTISFLESHATAHVRTSARTVHSRPLPELSVNHAADIPQTI